MTICKVLCATINYFSPVSYQPTSCSYCKELKTLVGELKHELFLAKTQHEKVHEKWLEAFEITHTEKITSVEIGKDFTYN